MRKYFSLNIILCAYFFVNAWTLSPQILAYEKKNTGVVQQSDKKKSENTGVYSYQEWWIFYDQLKMPGYEATSWRPLFISQKHFLLDADSLLAPGTIDEKRPLLTRRLFFIPPVFDVFQTVQFSNYSFLQLMDYTVLYPASESLEENKQGLEGDLGIFPFFWYGWGQSPQDNYWALFPFYGHIKSKLGQDYIRFIFFPIWINYGYRKIGYEATSIFYPFFLHGRAQDRLELRFFPFFHYSRHDNNFTRISVLWPFYFYERNYLYSTAPQTVQFLFPIYGYKDRFLARTHLVFWPFFSWGTDAMSQVEEYTILWPLFHWANGQDPFMRKRYFFPFYGEYQYGEKRSRYITPFFFSMLNQKTSYISRQEFILPMFWLSEVYKPSEKFPYKLQKTSFYFKFWPVMHIKNDYQNQSYQVNILSPLWFKADETIEDFYAPFWSLFTYKKLPMAQLSHLKKWYEDLKPETKKGSQFEYMSFLFRLYSQWHLGDTFHWQIPLLAHYTSKDEGGMRFSFLHGLFEVNTMQHKQKKTDQHGKDSKKNQKSVKKPARYKILWLIEF